MNDTQYAGSLPGLGSLRLRGYARVRERVRGRAGGRVALPCISVHFSAFRCISAHLVYFQHTECRGPLGTQRRGCARGPLGLALAVEGPLGPGYTRGPVEAGLRALHLVKPWG